PHSERSVQKHRGRLGGLGTLPRGRASRRRRGAIPLKLLEPEQPHREDEAREGPYQQSEDLRAYVPDRRPLNADLTYGVVQERQRKDVGHRPDERGRRVLREEDSGKEELRERDELGDRRHLVLAGRPTREREADRQEQDRSDEGDDDERNEATDDRDIEENQSHEKQHRDLARR